MDATALLCWWLWCVQLYAIASENKETEESFIEPVVGNNAEYYDHKDLTYVIVLVPTTHAAARLTCKSKSAELLELMEEEAGLFVARALAESAVGFSAVWVGGEFKPGLRDADNKQLPGNWRWVSGKPISIPVDPDIQFPLDTPPYWLDRPNLTMTRPHCLIMDRNLHDRPLITALPCNQKRPFVCVLAKPDYRTKPQEIYPTLKVGDKVYHLFQAQLTWYEALDFCENLHFGLAEVSRNEVFLKLQERMRRTRPILENAWVGGIYDHGRWTWVSTNEDISLEVNSKRNGTNGTEDIYTPWYRPQNIAMEGCLLADRHLCEYFVFVEASCERRRSVLCQEVPYTKIDEFTVINETDFYMSTLPLSWDDAQKKCQFCLGSNWTVLQLSFFNSTILRQQMSYVYKAMSEHVGVEVRHMWLNGRMQGGKLYWGYAYDGALIAGSGTNMALISDMFGNSTTSLLNYKGDDGFLFFCQDDPKTDPFLAEHRCLNLDRENQKHFFMYGLKCSFKQHYICAHGRYTGIHDDCRGNVLVYKNRRRY